MHVVIAVVVGFVAGVVATAIYGYKARAALTDRVHQLENSINQHLP